MVNDGISLGVPLTGQPIKRIKLDGWSAQLPAFTSNGRIWWVSDGGEIEIYADEALDLLIASGTVSGTLATLESENSSGITGLAETLDGAPDGTGMGIVSYANEVHLAAQCPQHDSFLVDDEWPPDSGINRFESAFDQARQELEGWVQRIGATEGAPRWHGRVDMTRLVDPWQLATVHALLTAAEMQSRSAALNLGGREEADAYYRRAKQKFQALSLVWQSGAIAQPLTQPRLIRG
jgi:hypothetical protein